MYERSVSGQLQEGYPFEIRPDKFYIYNEALDYAIVYVENNSISGTASLNNFGYTKLIETKEK